MKLKEKVVIGVCCPDCGEKTPWEFENIIRRDRDRDVVYCGYCGSGMDFPKKDMMKVWLKVKFGA